MGVTVRGFRFGVEGVVFEGQGFVSKPNLFPSAKKSLRLGRLLLVVVESGFRV